MRGTDACCYGSVLVYVSIINNLIVGSMDIRAIFLLGFSLVSALPGVCGVVADRTDHLPVGFASVFDCRGTLLGFSDASGRLPAVDAGSYPLTLQSMGYEPLVADAVADTLFMMPKIYPLAEVTVSASEEHPVRHTTAYVREYISMTSGNDTVIVFGEYLADFMTLTKKVKGFKGFNTPRVLARRTITHYGDISGRDSLAVNAEDTQMLSMVAMASLPDKPMELPESLRGHAVISDTVAGKHSIARIINAGNRGLTFREDFLADKKDHRWSPWIFKMFGLTTDFEEMWTSRDYSFSEEGMYPVENLRSISINATATCKGKMFRFLTGSQGPTKMNVLLEIYPFDHEYLTVTDANDLKKNPPRKDKIIMAPQAPPLPAEVREMTDRAVSRK